MAIFVLMAVSFFWYPGWVIPFLRAVLNNLRADFGFSTRQIIERYLPGYGTGLSWAATAFLVVLLAREWRTASGNPARDMLWCACVTLAATPLLGQRTESGNLALLILPWPVILQSMQERWKTAGSVLVVLLLALEVAGPWLLMRRGAAVFGMHADDLIFLFLPLTTLVGLYWMRWWALRPPRTWADQLPGR